MPGDYSRISDQPHKRFAALLMQQGRVQLDADWNESVTLLKRRIETEANDVFGAAAVPRATTPDGFKIGFTTTGSKPDLTIAPGRIYVDGILVECFAEDAATYLHQPYVKGTAPALAGDLLVYLDVWQREVTSVEDPSIVDSALGGIDTGTRLETVWQVKVRAPDEGKTVACDVDFGALFPASGGRLSTRTQKPSEAPDPCSLPDAGGYQGVDNRLYRVEVHDPATGQIKWSRDNGSVVSRVVALAHGSDTTLTVVRVGRDEDLGFRPNDWVEVTDDVRELSATPGVMAKVRSVDPATRAIVLVGSIAAAGFDLSGANNLRVRRWDQTEASEGFDAKTGLVTPKAGDFFSLENGVQAKLITISGGALHAADAWVFAARATDGKVEELTDAPPVSIRHHYASLATVKGVGGGSTPVPSDCRALWPPLGTGGDDCGCVVCVEAAAHNAGTFTIAQAIEQAKHSGGTVCLGVGTFEIGEGGIRIEDAKSLRLRGQGVATRLHFVSSGAALTVRASYFVDVLDLVIDCERASIQACVALEDSLFVAVERCVLTATPTGEGKLPFGFGVVFSGYLGFVRVRENLIVAPVGSLATTALGYDAKTFIAAQHAHAANTATGFFGLEVSDNIILSSAYGVYWGALLVFAQTSFTDNLVAAGLVGLRIGGVVSGGAMQIARNRVGAGITAIALAVSDAAVRDNVISGSVNASTDETLPSAGIVLDGGSGDGSVGAVRAAVEGNQISTFQGYGVYLGGKLARVAVRANQIDGIGGGIVMDPQATADDLVIESNDLRGVGASTKAPLLPATVGIGTTRVTSLVVRGNVLRDVGSAVSDGSTITAIRVMQPNAAIVDDNVIELLGPGDGNSRTVGIDVMGVFNDVRVRGNRVRARAGAGSLPYSGIVVRAGMGELVDPAKHFRIVPIDEERVVMMTEHNFILLPLGQQDADVSGNVVDVRASSQPLVSVLVGGASFVRANRVAIVNALRPRNDPASAPAGTYPAPAVEVSSITLVAGENQINAFAGVTALALTCPQKNGRITVLGNVCTTPITLNAAPLPDPWRALNVGG